MQAPLQDFDGINLFTGDRRDFRDYFRTLVKKRGRGRCLCYLNPHVSNLARDHADLAAALRKATFVLPDGHGSVWAARRLGLPIRQRLALSDLVEDIASQCARTAAPLFIWGGKKGVAEAALQALAQRHPGLVPAGHADGFLVKNEEEALVRKLKKHPGWVVLVGQGSPRQELLCMEISSEKNSPLAVAVGNAPAFAAGLDRRAPALLRSMKLEWAWRLLLDPLGMWKRYLLGSLRFVWHELRREKNHGR